MIGYYGDTSKWAMGVVEDINDPLRAGRVRVRVYGLHSEDANLLPFSDLPWSQVMLPITDAGVSGIGSSPTGLKVGSLVFGQFLDGESKQNLLVLGAMPGLAQPSRIQGVIQESPDILTGGSRAEQIFNFFKSQRFTDEQSAGILAAMVDQIGLTLETDRTSRRRYGLGLWTEDEVEALNEFAIARNATIDDLQTQLLYISQEIPITGWPGIIVSEDSVNKELIEANTAEDASDAFVQGFYRKSVRRNRRSRHQYSRQALSAYGFISNDADIGPFAPAQAVKAGELGSIIETREHLRALFASTTRSINELIVHHTDTYENMQTDAFDVNDWHIQNGFREIGYHFLILRDGRIQQGRNINQAGSHAANRNSKTVGVAFVGGRRGHSSSGLIDNSSDTFTDIQWSSFDTFILTWLEVFPNSSILGHGDIQNNRTDPNFDVRKYVASRASQWTSTVLPAPAQVPETSGTMSSVESAGPVEAHRIEERTKLERPEPVRPPEEIPVQTQVSTFVPVVTTPSLAPSEPDNLPDIPDPFQDPISSIFGGQNDIDIGSLINTITDLIPSSNNSNSLSNAGLSESDVTNTINQVLADFSFDASFFNGRRPDFYLDYNNLTNTPVAQNLNSTTDLIEGSNLYFTNDRVTNLINASYINGLNVNADTLDGENRSFYLDYNNFVNTPSLQNISSTSDVDEGSNLYFTNDRVTNLIDKPYVDDLSVNAAMLQNNGADFYLNYNNFTNVPSGIWTDQNDGAGSGLDADLLDGLHGSSYIKNTGIQTIERLRISATSDASLTSTAHGFQIGLDTGANLIIDNNEIIARNNGAPANLDFNIDSGSVNVNGNRVYHAGNDGAGSGLDADLLDGLHGSSYIRQASIQSLNMNDFNITNVRTLSGRSTSSRDKLRVWTDSRFAIGMGSSYTYGGLNDFAMTFQMSNHTTRGWWWGHESHSNAQGAASLTTTGIMTVAGSFTAAGNITENSDIRLKDNINELTNTLDIALKMQPVSFDWKDELLEAPRGSDFGFIAQWEEENLPELITKGSQHGFKDLRSLDYGKVSVIAIGAIKEQQKIISILNRRINELERHINS